MIIAALDGTALGAQVHRCPRMVELEINVPKDTIAQMEQMHPRSVLQEHLGESMNFYLIQTNR